MEHMLKRGGPRTAVATFVPAVDTTFGRWQRVEGYVTFTELGARPGVRVRFQLSGFAPGAVHAVHVHEFGDLRDGCDSLGGHFNPTGDAHGSIWVPEHGRHAGDLINNLRANHKGEVVFEYEDPMLSIDGPHGVIGRSVVIHQGVDDLGLGGYSDSKTTGHAGGRMACAVIGLAASTDL